MARCSRHCAQSPPKEPRNDHSSLVLRPATSADAADLERLAALDSARPLAGDVLLAYAGGEVRAALVARERPRRSPTRSTRAPSSSPLLRAAAGERPRRRRAWRRAARAVRPALA